MIDYHNHTWFSEDSKADPDIVIQAAISMGLEEIAITDHYDPDYPDPNFIFDLDFENYHKKLEELCLTYSHRIGVKKGIEIGIQPGPTLQKCSETASSYDYDFVIGSFHCFQEFDLYTIDFSESDNSVVLPKYYEYVYSSIKDYSDYDVIGHLNVIDRYLDGPLDYSKSMYIIEEILKKIIYDGKGIEINGSSYKYGMGDRTTPSQDMLQLYKNLGGEILTIGSDSHRPEEVGTNIDKMLSQANSVGFEYLTTFSKRKPHMVRNPHSL